MAQTGQPQDGGAAHNESYLKSWISGQRQRLCQLAPGSWEQALAGVLGGSPGRQDDGSGHPVVEIAIYPDVVWLADRSLQAHDTSHSAAS